MAMIGTVVDHRCPMNPVDGFTVLREIGLGKTTGGHRKDLILGTILYTFHEPCTGRIKVTLATGSFFRSSGQEIEFNMGPD